MSYIVSTSILGIQTFVTRFDPSAGDGGHLEHLECRLQPLPPGRFAKELG